MEKKYIVSIEYNGEKLYFVNEIELNGERFADFSPLHTKAKAYDYKSSATMRVAWLKLFGYDGQVEPFYRVSLEN